MKNFILILWLVILSTFAMGQRVAPADTANHILHSPSFQYRSVDSTLRIYMENKWGWDKLLTLRDSAKLALPYFPAGKIAFGNSLGKLTYDPYFSYAVGGNLTMRYDPNIYTSFSNSSNSSIMRFQVDNNKYMIQGVIPGQSYFYFNYKEGTESSLSSIVNDAYQSKLSLTNSSTGSFNKVFTISNISNTVQATVRDNLTGAQEHPIFTVAGKDLDLGDVYGNMYGNDSYTNLYAEGMMGLRVSPLGQIALGGILSPTAALHLPSGTTAPNTAPLKFTSGPLTTAAEAGTIQYYNNGFYIRTPDSLVVDKFVDRGLTKDRIVFSGAGGKLTDDTKLYWDGSTLWNKYGTNDYISLKSIVNNSILKTSSNLNNYNEIGNLNKTGSDGSSYINSYYLSFPYKSYSKIENLEYGSKLQQNFTKYASGSLFDNTGLMMTAEKAYDMRFLDNLTGSATFIAGYNNGINIFGDMYGEKSVPSYFFSKGLIGMLLDTTGNIGISAGDYNGATFTPTARLHINAGSATAGTAPLKFTSGPLLTTPEPGAIEYYNGKFTIRGTDSLSTPKLIVKSTGYGVGKTLVSNAYGELSYATPSSGSVTSVATGLGLSGGPISTTGTLAVDTANVSILSRQRAANTYQPKGSYQVSLNGTGFVKMAGTSVSYTAPSTVGQNYLTLTNPSAVTFPRMNADNTVSSLDATSFRTAIGAGTSSTTGTVTSVGLTMPTGFTVTGSPVTTSGTLTASITAGYYFPTTTDQTNWGKYNQWDGGATGLTAATGRTSLGGTTVGQNLFTLTNPTAITFPRINADNSVSTLDAATFRTAIGAGTSSATGTVTSVATGLGLSGGTITGTGTIVLDTANVSVLSRQRAANTYQPKGSYITLTSLSNTAPITYNNSSGAIGITQATTSTNGYLSSTDWNTFNGKTSNTGTVTNITMGDGLASTQSPLTTTGTMKVDTSQTMILSRQRAANAYQPKGAYLTDSEFASQGIMLRTATSGAYSILTDNSTNWNTAYTDRNQWDGGATGLTAATGRASLGGTTVGQNFFTLVNPTAITFPRINTDNSVSTLDAASFRTAIGAGTSSTSGTVTSVATGLGLSGGTITSIGTLLVDTANVSILSRQRAANAYQPKGTYTSGAGTTNYIPKYTGANTIGNSSFWESGGSLINVGSTPYVYQIWKDATPTKGVGVGISTDDLAFSVYNGTAWGTKMTLVNSTGMLGIGYTADPIPAFSTKLAVNGNTIITGVANISNGVITPVVQGGEATISSLTLQPTSAASPTTAAKILFKTGSAGGTNAMQIESNGLVSIGTTATGAAFLNLAAGSAGGVPPLVINNGTLTTTPVPNAIENNGTNLYYTTSAGSRAILGGGAGTVTSVAALTLGTTGTDLSSTVATNTTTPVITLNVPTASAANRGALSSTDWSTFNGKGSVSSVAVGLGLKTVSGSAITTTGTVLVDTANVSILSRQRAANAYQVKGDYLTDSEFASQGIMLRGATSGNYSILTDNSTNWNKYNQWDGASTGLTAATGRTSLQIPFAVQALSGTSVAWNTTNGLNATLTLTGNTTLTLSNLVAGQTGNIRVTNAASTYTLTMAGYTNKFAPTIYLTTNQVKTSGSSKIDVYSFFYDGTYLIWNGTQGYL